MLGGEGGISIIIGMVFNGFVFFLFNGYVSIVKALGRIGLRLRWILF